MSRSRGRRPPSRIKSVFAPQFRHGTACRPLLPASPPPAAPTTGRARPKGRIQPGSADHDHRRRRAVSAVHRAGLGDMYAGIRAATIAAEGARPAGRYTGRSALRCRLNRSDVTRRSIPPCLPSAIMRQRRNAAVAGRGSVPAAARPQRGDLVVADVNGLLWPGEVTSVSRAGTILRWRPAWCDARDPGRPDADRPFDSPPWNAHLLPADLIEVRGALASAAVHTWPRRDTPGLP